ncbi:hypothetical protein, partial [Microvirga flocculans]|uniref:hypothetical protein n=1 Tax=Microvirga flocculans TaxID=217168 RepID=UPI001AEEF78B
SAAHMHPGFRRNSGQGIMPRLPPQEKATRSAGAEANRLLFSAYGFFYCRPSDASRDESEKIVIFEIFTLC